MKLLKGQLKTLKSCLEERIGHVVPVSHPWMAWLVSRAADVRTFRVGSDDGTTAYQKIRGRAFSTNMLGFGDVCRFKTRAHEIRRDGAHAYRWDEGIFVGMCKLTGQYRLYCDGVIRAARTIRRLLEQQQFDSHKLQQINRTPWKLLIPRGRVLFCNDELRLTRSSTRHVRML